MLIGSAWSVKEDSAAFWEAGGGGRSVSPTDEEGFGRPNLFRALYAAKVSSHPAEFLQLAGVYPKYWQFEIYLDLHEFLERLVWI